MAAGSYLRFGVGLALSVEVLRDWFLGNGFSYIALLLALIFIMLSAVWIVFRF